MTPTTADDGARYRAVFTNPSGTAASNAATLTVLGGPAAPVVSQHPGSVVVRVDTFATFTAAARGEPPPTAEWQLSTDGGSSWTPFRGETATTLTLPAFAASDGFQYRAVFTNSQGSATTNAATLWVQDPPTVTGHPVAQTAAPGAPASFSAKASGQPAPTVQWQVRVAAGAWTDIGGATALTYTFTAAPGDHGAQYRAMFTNAAGMAISHVATLTVAASAVAPVVTLHPASVTAPANTFTTFTAAATGEPAPTVQWQVSTDGGATWTSLRGGTASTLTVPVFAVSDGYRYRAVFTNSQGSAATDPATLTVPVAPAGLRDQGLP